MIAKPGEAEAAASRMKPSRHNQQTKGARPSRATSRVAKEVYYIYICIYTHTNICVCVLCVLMSYYYVGQDKKSYTNGSIGQESSTFGTRKDLQKSNPSRETILSQRATIAKICEEGNIFLVLKHFKL